MKLSIITINRNNAQGLQKTMESVLNQTSKEFEYIVIDGASTDDSVSVIQRFEAMIPHLSYLSEPDNGVFHAMNKGIKRATGDYLLFLNSGDFLINEQVLNGVFSEQPVADIICARCNVSDNGTVVWTTNPPIFFTLSSFYNTTLAHQSTFIKRALFDKFGLYREDLKLMGDWEFWIRTIILGHATTEKSDVVLTDYNLDGISSNQTNLAQMTEEKKTVYRDLNLERIIADYDNWQKEKQELKVLYWVKSKNWIYKPITCVYDLISRFKQK